MTGASGRSTIAGCRVHLSSISQEDWALSIIIIISAAPMPAPALPHAMGRPATGYGQTCTHWASEGYICCCEGYTGVHLLRAHDHMRK